MRYIDKGKIVSKFCTLKMVVIKLLQRESSLLTCIDVY